MRILVTGGSGFIGSNLVRHLLTETTHEVLNLDKLTYAGYPASLADLVEHPSYGFRQACLCDRAAVDAAFSYFEPEAVMHLAAESHVDRSIDGPAEFIATNVMGTYTLLEASRAYLKHASNRTERFRFLHVSTDEVFGSLGPNDPPFNERTAYAPRSPYSASKAASDHLVRAWHTTYGLPVLVSNCSNNYGPYQFPEKLIPTVILKALNHDRIPVYGTGDNIRDWIFVEDHVRALLRLLEQGQPGDTFSIGAGAEVRNIDLVRTLCELLDEHAPNPPSAGHASLITFVQDRPGHDHRYAIDASRITTELGWSPQHALNEGLRTTVEWYLNNPNWWQPLLADDNNAIDRRGLSTEHASL